MGAVGMDGAGVMREAEGTLRIGSPLVSVSERNTTKGREGRILDGRRGKKGWMHYDSNKGSH